MGQRDSQWAAHDGGSAPGRAHAARADRARRQERGHPGEILALQRAIGNRAVTTLLQRGRRVGAVRGAVAINSASQHAQQDFNALPNDAKDAIRAILADRTDARYARGPHLTDPETGAPKQQGIGVAEYHVHPNRAARIVVRTHNQDTRVYWDPNHTQNSYIYHRVINLPPPPAPQPQAAVAVPVQPPVAVAVQQPQVQQPPAQLPVPDSWEDIAE